MSEACIDVLSNCVKKEKSDYSGDRHARTRRLSGGHTVTNLITSLLVVQSVSQARLSRSSSMFVQTLRRMPKTTTLQRTRQVAQHMLNSTSASATSASPGPTVEVRHSKICLAFVLSILFYDGEAHSFVRGQWLCSAIHS